VNETEVVFVRISPVLSKPRIVTGQGHDHQNTFQNASTMENTEYSRYEKAIAGRDLAQERLKFADQKRERMRTLIKQISEYYTLGMDCHDIAFTLFFFELLKKTHGRDGKGTGFWDNRNTIWENINDVQIIVIDFDYMKKYYRETDLILDAIVSPEEYTPYVMHDRYLFLGWCTFKKAGIEGEEQGYRYTVNYFDAFLRGYNIGYAMLEDLAKSFAPGFSIDDVLPCEVLERTNAYWSKFPIWDSLTFEKEVDLCLFLEEHEYENPEGFMEELKKQKNRCVKAWSKKRGNCGCDCHHFPEYDECDDCDCRDHQTKAVKHE
jgi:hypothetical protein